MFKFIMKQDSTFDMQEEEYALSKDIDVALWIDYRTFYGKCPLKELLGGNLIIVNEHFQDEFEEFRGKIQCAIGTTHILVKGIELPKLWLKSINAYLKSVAVLGSTYFLISSSDLDDICQWVTVTQKLYRAKIVPGENCTGRYNFRNQNCTARYNFGCEKCTGLAKSVPGSA